MELTSKAFANQSNIPKKYTCDGKNINPELDIEKLPEGTESLVLIVDDPDAVNGCWVHWVVYDIPPCQRIPENCIPGKQGLNDFKMLDWGVPCPSSGTHRYNFKLYALSEQLKIDEGCTKTDVETAMTGKVIAEAILTGIYQRPGKPA